MDAYVVLRDFILADPALSAELGTRVYPIKLPQSAAYPAMTIQKVSGTALPPLKGRASLARPRYQCDVWTREGQGSAAGDAQRIGRLLLDRLEGATFLALDEDVSPAVDRIVAIEFETDRDLYEPDAGGGGFYRYSADYFVHHQTGHGSGNAA